MSAFSNPAAGSTRTRDGAANPRRGPARLPATYVYDGSFDGFLGVVFEATRRRETPASIETGPALALGPIVEHLAMLAGTLF